MMLNHVAPQRSTVATIDPGMSGTGIAIWNRTKWLKKVVPPEQWIVLNPDSSLSDWKERASCLCSNVVGYLIDHGVEIVYVEQPEFFDTLGGHMVASKGDLAKLIFFFGALFQDCIGENIQVYSAFPREWKGQLKKEVVNRRILNVLPGFECKSHAWDAVGIGLWAQGFMP